MDVNVIKSYLVELGFEVDHPELAKFNDALRTVGKVAEAATSGVVKSVVGAGTALTTMLTGVATGTIALADKVAQQDLGFQLFARRMFMSADAAKALKIATDALGYSLEDIVWGPPELQQRYRDLIAYQQGTAVAPDLEVQLRRIRDIRFEVTKLQVGAQLFVMNLTASLGRLLFGDEEGILKKLREWNAWLQENSTRLADQLAKYLVPVLRDVGRILNDVFQISRMLTGEFIKFVGVVYGDGKLQNGAVTIDNLGRSLDHVSSSIRSIFDFLVAHPDISKILFGAAIGSAAGALVGGPGGAVVGGVLGAAGMAGIVAGQEGEAKAKSYHGQGLTRKQIQFLIGKVAAQLGVDPALAEAIAEQESGFNPMALNPKSGARGLFQLMPGTARGLGVDPENPYQNILGGLTLLKRLLAQHHGDLAGALKDYGGFVTADPSEYIGSVMRRYRRWSTGGPNGAMLQPSAMTRIDVGGIQVHVTEPHATKEEIYRETLRAVNNSMTKQVQRNIVQQSGVFA